MELLAEKRKEILAIAAQHGARNVRVFRSAAREGAGEGSHIDFLLSTKAETSPWFPAGLVQELEALLGRDSRGGDRAEPVLADPRAYPARSKAAVRLDIAAIDR